MKQEKGFFRLVPETGFSVEEQKAIRSYNSFSTRYIASMHAINNYFQSVHYHEVDQYNRTILTGINLAGYSASIAIVENKGKNK